MIKKNAAILIVNLILLIIINTSSAQIIVEDASYIWEAPLNPIVVDPVEPRILAEYATDLIDYELIFPYDLILSTDIVTPRIIGEYTTTMLHYELVTPPCKGDFDFDGDVDGRDMYFFSNDLDMYPLIIFLTSFGRRNCE